MSLKNIANNIDISKIKSSSGLTFSQELVNAANLLRNCIQNKINHGTLRNSISVADLADIKVEKNSLKIVLSIQNSIRPSIFNEKGYTNKNANIFWLLNDGFTVKKTWAFRGFKYPERWIYREAEKFVEQGINDFNSKSKLPIEIKIKRPMLYYG